MRRNLMMGVIISVIMLILLGACDRTPDLGSEGNPVIWSFVPSGDPERVEGGAEAVAAMLQDKTGIFVETNVAADYAGVIRDLSTDPPKVHISSLATFAYILAADRGVVEAALVSVRFGSPTYNAQFIAHRDSGIRRITDLRGKSFARPDLLSTSGWVIPMLTMRAAGINPDKELREILDLGSHELVVKAVYTGDVDAGSTYVDARSRLEEEYPDVMDKVLVFQVTSDIPNDGVQFSPAVPPDMREKIVRALLEIMETAEGKEALSRAYQWEGLEEQDDSFYDPFRQVLQASGLGIDALQK